jgi:hypothetical protein
VSREPRSTITTVRGKKPAAGSAAQKTARSGSATVVSLHLQLDQAVHLDRVLHRELLDDRLDEAVDDQLAASSSGMPRDIR